MSAATPKALDIAILGRTYKVTPAGATAARVDDAVERLAVAVPELSRDALRLLVAERMSQERGLDDVPLEALRAVSRGLDALGVAEANEMRAIYQKVWDPYLEGAAGAGPVGRRACLPLLPPGGGGLDPPGGGGTPEGVPPPSDAGLVRRKEGGEASGLPCRNKRRKRR